MKRFIFSILMMANLAAHQATADVEPKCKVQGNPWVSSDRLLYVRGADNHLREWQFTTKEGEEQARWYVTDLIPDDGPEIMSDPFAFSEYYGAKRFQMRDDKGDPIFDDFGLPKMAWDGKDTIINHVVARGRRGHLLEYRRLQRFSYIPDESDAKQEIPTPWQWSDLTTATGGRTIAGTPSLDEARFLSSDLPLHPLKRHFVKFLWYFGELNDRLGENFFATPTPDDHLLQWSLPRLSADKLILTAEQILKEDDRVWSVKNLTDSGNGQTSAGNALLNYSLDRVLTRSPEGHLLSGKVEPEPVIDLTAVVDGQPTIVGDPANYGDIFQTAANQLLGLQYVFARDLNGHLLVWQHRQVGELEIPPAPEITEWDGNKKQVEDYWKRLEEIEKLWNTTMPFGWEWSDLTAATEGKRTIASNPTVYTAHQVDENAEYLILNVLARSDDGHLLRWSITVLSKLKEEEYPSFNESGTWKVEDLTNISGGKIIKGEPIGIERTYIVPTKECPSDKPECDDSERSLVVGWLPFESIFVTDENDHLLEWQGQLVSLFKWEKGSTVINAFQLGYWQVTDLTEDCDPVKEGSPSSSSRDFNPYH